MGKDYYKILGVLRNADLKTIKKAYRNRVKKLHPDATHSNTYTEQFIEIEEAYEALSDKLKRKQYDENLFKEPVLKEKNETPEDNKKNKYHYTKLKTVLYPSRDQSYGFLSVFINKLTRKKEELFVTLRISPMEALSGGTFPITFPVLQSCPNCISKSYREKIFCSLCSGRGRIETSKTIILKISSPIPHRKRIRKSLNSVSLNRVSLVVTFLVEGIGE